MMMLILEEVLLEILYFRDLDCANRINLGNFDIFSGDVATFIGNFDYFEIWDKLAYEELTGKTR